MTSTQDEKILYEKITKYGISNEIATPTIRSVRRILAIDESKTFAYEPINEFEKRLPLIQKLKEKATESFRPFANKFHTSLCASMGVPMMDAISYSNVIGTYQALHEIFGVTNAKAKRFGLAALYCAVNGQQSAIPDNNGIYNIVFDRDSPWTYRNEVEHMEEYARYHFNSYVINEIKSTMEHLQNPFEPVIALYQQGCADFIFMQTEEDRTREEKLCTFHIVNIPKKGNIIAVHMTGDEYIKYYRNWGEPYFMLRSTKDIEIKLKIVGIADQRFIPD